MAKKINANRSDDMIQDMYLKIYDLHKRGRFTTEGKDKNKVSMYIYLTLKSIAINSWKEIRLDELTGEEKENISLSTQKPCIADVENITENWNWYDKKVFEVYLYDRGTSIRGLSEETGISEASLYYTIKKCKRKIKENWNE